MTDFSRMAARYDAGLLGRVSRSFYGALETVAAPFLVPGARVLDVGCGTGALLVRLVAQHQIVATGIDPSPEMARIAQGAHPELSICTGQAEHLPFAANSFEMVLACLSYHHFDKQQAFITEARRVLVPGGRLFIAEPNVPKPVRFILRHSARIIPHSEVFHDPADIAESLVQNGFTADIPYQHRLIAIIGAIKAAG